MQVLALERRLHEAHGSVQMLLDVWEARPVAGNAQGGGGGGLLSVVASRYYGGGGGTADVTAASAEERRQCAREAALKALDEQLSEAACLENGKTGLLARLVDDDLGAHEEPLAPARAMRGIASEGAERSTNAYWNAGSA